METKTPASATRALALAAALLSITTTVVHAQAAGAASARVGGAELQSWLDQKFSYAGVHRPSQCVILNVAQAEGRVLFIRCPNGWAEKIAGTARVVGDTYCTRFPVPNTPAAEDCVTWHRVGPWRFEQRKGDVVDTSVVVLPQGLGDDR